MRGGGEGEAPIPCTWPSTVLQDLEITLPPGPPGRLELLLGQPYLNPTSIPYPALTRPPTLQDQHLELLLAKARLEVRQGPALTQRRRDTPLKGDSRAE